MRAVVLALAAFSLAACTHTVYRLGPLDGPGYGANYEASESGSDQASLLLRTQAQQERSLQAYEPIGFQDPSFVGPILPDITLLEQQLLLDPALLDPQLLDPGLMGAQDPRLGMPGGPGLPGL